MVGEFRRTLPDELDCRQEARNLERLGENPEKFDRLLVALVVSIARTDESQGEDPDRKGRGPGGSTRPGTQKKARDGRESR